MKTNDVVLIRSLYQEGASNEYLLPTTYAFFEKSEYYLRPPLIWSLLSEERAVLY